MRRPGRSGGRRAASQAEAEVDHPHEPGGQLVDGARGEVAQRSLEGQHGEAVHRRPGEQLGARALRLGQHARLGHVVEGVAEQLEGRAARGSRGVGRGRAAQVDGHGEGGAEEARLVHGEAEVAHPDGAEPRPRAVTGRHTARHGLDRRGDHVGRAGLGDRDDLVEERIAVGEVPVGRVGRDAHPPRRLAQHDLVGAALAGELGAGLEQRAAQVAVVVGRAGRDRRVLRAGRGGGRGGHADIILPPGSDAAGVSAQKPKRRAVARTASAEARRPASSASVIGTSTRAPTPPACTIAGTDRQTSLMP